MRAQWMLATVSFVGTQMRNVMHRGRLNPATADLKAQIQSHVGVGNTADTLAPLRDFKHTGGRPPDGDAGGCNIRDVRTQWICEETAA